MASIPHILRRLCSFAVGLFRVRPLPAADRLSILLAPLVVISEEVLEELVEVLGIGLSRLWLQYLPRRGQAPPLRAVRDHVQAQPETLDLGHDRRRHGRFVRKALDHQACAVSPTPVRSRFVHGLDLVRLAIALDLIGRYFDARAGQNVIP